MAHAIRAVAGAGQRGRRPEPPGLLVAAIERLAAGVADRVVVPGREPELMRILRPRVAGVRFAGHAAEPGIGQHVRSEENTPELQSLMRISYAGFTSKKKQTH